MDRPLLPRVVALLLLAAFGVGAGLAGTAVGIDSPFTSAEPSGEVSVSETNITFSHANGAVTVLRSVNDSESVQITEAGGDISIDTEPVEPLTERERERALEIARANATVQQRLAEIDEYELTVEPIKAVPADTMTEVSFNVSVENTSRANESEGTFRVDPAEQIETGDDTVTITPGDQTYVEDDVDVEISVPGESEPRYRVQVDLKAERVVIVAS